jgi:ribosomal protein S18 acetylase RimI-like enzyme
MAVHIRIRDLRVGDQKPLERLLQRVEVFEPHEIRVAMELVAGALGPSGDYLIYVAEDADDDRSLDDGAIVGYICHGHNPVTDAVHDVYWIAVDPGVQGRGVGGQLLGFAEERVRALRGRAIVIETSSRTQYAAARRLYEKHGYQKAADIKDFYKPGDHQLIYMKFMTSPRKAS